MHIQTDTLIYITIHFAIDIYLHIPTYAYMYIQYIHAYIYVQYIHYIWIHANTCRYMQIYTKKKWLDFLLYMVRLCLGSLQELNPWPFARKVHALPIDHTFRHIKADISTIDWESYLNSGSSMEHFRNVIMAYFMPCIYIHVYVCSQMYLCVHACICMYLYVSYQCSHSLMAMIAFGKGSTRRLAWAAVVLRATMN